MSSETTAVEAQLAAQEALRYAAELGCVVSFLEQICHAHTQYEVGSKLIKTLQLMGLKGAFKVFDGVDTVGCWGNLNPMQETLLENCRWEKRMMDICDETIFSWDFCSLILSEMPVDDEMKFGSIKDSMATLLNGADQRLRELRQEQEMHAGIKEIHETLAESIARIEHKIGDAKTNTARLVDEVLMTVEEDVASLDLFSEQDAIIIKSVRNLATGLTEISDASITTISAELSVAIDCVSRLADKQPVIEELTPDEAFEAAKQKDSELETVELF